MRAEPKERLAAEARQVWMIEGSILTSLLLLITIVLVVLTRIFDLLWYLPVGAATITLIFASFFIWMYPRLRYRRWRYEIYEHEIELKQGVFFVKRTVIPMVRIQHVDTEQGPLLRKYGLAAVTFSTAAGGHQIPALSLEIADCARERIARLARESREDV
jgi:membrane protein YdbS with pleckstrin-like domain